jgi:hypothetical protein
MWKAVLLLVSLAGLAYPASKAYEVEPYKNCIGLQPQGYEGISQSYVNVLDSITKVSVWVGAVGDTSSYLIEVMEPDDYKVAEGAASPGTRSWFWLDIAVGPYQGREPVRGKTYKVEVTRENGSPISFAYDPNNIYTYLQRS